MDRTTPHNLDDIYGHGAENADDEAGESCDIEDLENEINRLQALLYAVIETAGGQLVADDEHIHRFQQMQRTGNEIKRRNDFENRRVVLYTRD